MAKYEPRSMPLIRSTTSRVAISDNTYPVKDQIKALGGRWDGDRKVWTVPASRAAEAQALVSGAPAGYVRTATTTTYHPTTCRVCGARAARDQRGYPTVKILRSGECVDCYEERKMGY